MAIVKIPREGERERRHDEDVCNLFLTRVAFHRGPTATMIFRSSARRNNSAIQLLDPRLYCNGYNFSEIVVVGPSQLSALPLLYPQANLGLLLRGGGEMRSERHGQKRLQHVGSRLGRLTEKSNRWFRSIIGEQ